MNKARLKKLEQIIKPGKEIKTLADFLTNTTDKSRPLSKKLARLLKDVEGRGV